MSYRLKATVTNKDKPDITVPKDHTKFRVATIRPKGKKPEGKQRWADNIS